MVPFVNIMISAASYKFSNLQCPFVQIFVVILVKIKRNFHIIGKSRKRIKNLKHYLVIEWKEGTKVLVFPILFNKRDGRDEDIVKSVEWIAPTWLWFPKTISSHYTFPALEREYRCTQSRWFTSSGLFSTGIVR